MTLQQVLKEVDIIAKVASDKTAISLTYEEVGSDEELIIYTKENNITIHKPCGQFPEYWFCVLIGKIDVIVKGKSKEILIN